MMGDARGSYLKDLSIHHSFNRGVTIHGTDNVVVQRNLAYDVVGHTFFLEDGAETGTRGSAGGPTAACRSRPWTGPGPAGITLTRPDGAATVLRVA